MHLALSMADSSAPNLSLASFLYIVLSFAVAVTPNRCVSQEDASGLYDWRPSTNEDVEVKGRLISDARLRIDCCAVSIE